MQVDTEPFQVERLQTTFSFDFLTYLWSRSYAFIQFLWGFSEGDFFSSFFLMFTQYLPPLCPWHRCPTGAFLLVKWQALRLLAPRLKWVCLCWGVILMTLPNRPSLARLSLGLLSTSWFGSAKYHMRRTCNLPSSHRALGRHFDSW